MRPHFLKKCLLLLCPFFGQQLMAQTLTWQPSTPIQQQQASFIYQAKGGDLEFSSEPKAILGYYRNNQWLTDSIVLKKAGDNWTGVFNVPTNTALIGLLFFQGNAQSPEASDNNNGKGYLTKVLTGKKTVSGTYLEEAAFRTATTGNWVLNGFIKPTKNPKQIDSLLQLENKLSGKISGQLLFKYLDLKSQTLPAEDFKTFADQRLSEELKQGKLNEEMLAGIQKYYDKIKNKAAAQEVEKRIFATYPKGKVARFIAFRNASEGKKGDDIHLAAEAFLKAFPYTEWQKNPDGSDFIYYTIFRNLGTQYFETSQNEKFEALFKDINFKTANEIYRWNLTRAQISGKGDMKLIYSFSKKIIPYLLARRNDGSYLKDFGNDSIKAKENEENQLNDRLFSHIFFAYNQNDFVEAERNFQYLSPAGQFKTADLNDLHMRTLEKLGKEKEIKNLIERSVAANAVTPNMFTKLKAIYKSEHQGNEDGYDQYLASLASSDGKAEILAHIKENMVNYPLPPFSLEDADGKFVNSNDFGDKIVVIDFWATWCRPCIMAFPGMQMLVDQYAKDPKVAIYLIGTMQFGDYKIKSVNYVRSEGYRFHLLHDAVGSAGAQDKVFKSLLPLFKQSSIPRKIIVKNGIVRYSSEGYSGSPSQLRDELSMAVEILRAEK